MLSLDNFEEVDTPRYSPLYPGKSRRRSSRRSSKSKKHRHRHRRTVSKKHSHRHSSHSRSDEDVCAVCLGDENITCQLLPCNHKFHGDCIAQWVERNFSCPLCRQEIGQFVPLKGLDTELMDRFEVLWTKHYKGDKDTTTSSDGGIGDKVDDELAKVVEVGVEIGVDVQEHQDSVVSAPEMEIELMPELDIGVAIDEDIQAETRSAGTLFVDERPKESIWSRVWNGLVISPKNTEGVVVGKESVDVIATTLALATSSGMDYLRKMTSIASNSRSMTSSSYSSSDYYWNHSTHKLPEAATRQTGSYQYEQGADDEMYFEDEAIQDSNVLPTTWNNFCAGSIAGLSATVATVLSTSRKMRGSGNLFKGNVPSVAVFFTSYEHLKTYLFHTDPYTKSYGETFVERFISAGIAGAVASGMVPKSNPLIGLRYAAFFGSFELFKDLRSSWIGQDRLLNLPEVGMTALLGGVVTSSLYYPSTRLLQEMTPLSLNLSLANGGVYHRSIGEMVSSLSQRGLMTGFTRHLAHFLPSCVTCSCVFEFSRRYLNGTY